MYPSLQIGHIIFPMFQLILFGAAFFCMFVYIISPKYEPGRAEMFMRCIPSGAVGAILGGKLIYAAVFLLQEGKWDFVQMLNGSVFYGGLLGGFLGIALFSKIRKRNPLDDLDVAASLLPLGQAIGRLGCYCNGCCYGCAYEGFAAVPYPVNGTWTMVFPTWFVESAACLTLFFILHFLVPKYRGIPAGWYLIGYALIRYFVEFHRADELRGVWNGTSTSQLISIAALTAGIWLVYFAAKHKQLNLYFHHKGEKDNGISAITSCLSETAGTAAGRQK